MKLKEQPVIDLREVYSKKSKLRKLYEALRSHHEVIVIDQGECCCSRLKNVRVIPLDNEGSISCCLAQKVTDRLN